MKDNEGWQKQTLQWRTSSFFRSWIKSFSYKQEFLSCTGQYNQQSYLSKFVLNNSKTILLTPCIILTKIELKHRTKVLTDKSSLYVMNEEQRKYLGKRFSIKYK